MIDDLEGVGATKDEEVAVHQLQTLVSSVVTNPIDVVNTIKNTIPQATISATMATNSKINATSVPPKAKKVLKHRVFFATRTHSQISQIANELKSLQSEYANDIFLRMSILGSREQYCIHPVVSKLANKSEECKKLSKKPSSSMRKHKSKSSETCIYGSNTHLFKKKIGLHDIWDVEDLVAKGRYIVLTYYIFFV